MGNIKINGTDVHEDDFRFIEGTPDPNFSPEHNTAVIASSIKKYNAKRREQIKAYGKQIQERSEAAASFLKHIDQGKSTPVEKYFSHQYLMELRGQKILKKVIDARNKAYRLEETN